MAHQSLYRAYRPQNFKEVVGQEQVTKPLAESIKAGKVGHAYLFAGSRGLGKTSVARIFAKEIGASEHDLYEIDAASNNSVEDIRALAEGVYTLPFESPYKVYILDEVHMLSKSAWNAFLKTLEEPPKHAVFIMATTELEKVPETVQSRCQVFEFKKPTRKDLAKLCAEVATKEGYTLAPEAAELIALLAEGSYRDLLSVLQRVLAGVSGKTVARGLVEEVTGAPRQELVQELVRALAGADTAKGLAAVARASKEGADMRLYLDLVIEALRAVLILRYAPDLAEELKAELGGEEYAATALLAKDSKITHDTLLAFLAAEDHVRYAPIPSLPVELAVLALTADAKRD